MVVVLLLRPLLPQEDFLDGLQLEDCPTEALYFPTFTKAKLSRKPSQMTVPPLKSANLHQARQALRSEARLPFQFWAVHRSLQEDWHHLCQETEPGATAIRGLAMQREEA